MKLQIGKLKREKFGPRSERDSRLLDQMALELEELESTATEDELAAERAAAKTTNVAPFTRNRRPASRSRNTCRASVSWWQPPPSNSSYFVIINTSSKHQKRKV
jgi:hypothetical protein